MDGHVHAFERFGGAARRGKYDSQKPVVLRWEGNQPIFNEVGTLWIVFYGEFFNYVELRPQLESRMAAAVYVKAYPGEEFRGTVDLVSPVMDEASRTIRLRIAVANPRGRLFAGMFADVKVFLPGAEEALALPRNAVLEDAGRSFVFIHHHGDYYVRRPVEPGRSWGDRVEVLQGLKGGETVVADGSFLLKSDVLRSKMGAGCAD
jgi:cobalt-zinc-cadmium efflux system membrane fusion protein